MLKHETFEELCALAATGELSPEEEARLADHLQECEILPDKLCSVFGDPWASFPRTGRNSPTRACFGSSKKTACAAVFSIMRAARVSAFQAQQQSQKVCCHRPVLAFSEVLDFRSTRELLQAPLPLSL